MSLNISNGHNVDSEKRTTDECLWLQSVRGLKTLSELKVVLYECICRLNNTRKLSKLPKLNYLPAEPRTVNLASHIHRDVFSGKATLLADEIQMAEVSFKYLRANGGVYKGTLRSQYKIQQLQDCGNKIVRAINVLTDGMEKYEKMTTGGKFTLQSAEYITTVLGKIRDLVKSGLSSLSPPDLCNYQELQSASVVGLLDPAPTPDLLFSFYVSADRLVCTAYQISQKASNTHSLTSYHAESRVDTLSKLHELLSNAHWIAESFLLNIKMFNCKSV